MKRRILGGALAGALAAATMATAPTLTTASAAATHADRSPKAAARQSAEKLIARDAAALKIGPQDAFKAKPVLSNSGINYAPYERTYRGLPVVGGDFVVVTDATGKVLTTSVAQKSQTALASTRPTVAASRARTVARGVLDTTTSASTPRLVVLQRAASKLAWEVEVRGSKDGEAAWQKVYVDAHSAKVAWTRELIAHGTGTAAYSGPNPLTIATSGSSGSYSMTDPSATTLKCQDAATKATFTGSDDAWGNGSATNKETGCVDALYGAQQMKAMMSSWLGRSGMNGSGGWVPIRVGLNETNAYYDGTQVQIGKNTSGAWISSIDVVAHEFGHGVDDKTPGGISGNGTQEFIGDAFATSTEYYDAQPSPYDVPDHTIGEEINLTGNGPIRDGSNPANVGDPSCYTSSIPTMEVHAAAGPGDHWFYLLSRGGTSKCDGTSVSGIGEQKALTVLYNAMLMKTSGASYLKYRTWTLTAAKNLDSTCAQFNSVKAAWDAVNVPAQSGDPTCSGGTTPPPTGSNLLANPGFESGSGVGWTGTSGPITNNTGRAARTGSWKMWLGGNGATSTEYEQQSVTIPANATAATLSYWIRLDTGESGSTAYDTMKVQIIDGSTTTTLKTFSNALTYASYTQFSHSLLAYKGKTVTVKFLMNEDASLQTSFVVDDTAVNVS